MSAAATVVMRHVILPPDVLRALDATDGGGTPLSQICPPQLCARCGKSEVDHDDRDRARGDKSRLTPKKLPCCRRCGLLRYCSKQCQTAHWKTHKRVCREAVLHANNDDAAAARDADQDFTRACVRLEVRWNILYADPHTRDALAHTWGVVSKESDYVAPFLWVEVNLAKIAEVTGGGETTAADAGEGVVRQMCVRICEKEVVARCSGMDSVVRLVSEQAHSAPDKFAALVVADTSSSGDTFPMKVLSLELT